MVEQLGVGRYWIASVVLALITMLIVMAQHAPPYKTRVIAAACVDTGALGTYERAPVIPSYVPASVR